MPPLPPQVIHDLVAADLADPGEQGGLAAEVLEVAHDLDQRGLDDLGGGVGITVQAGQGETVDPGKIVIKEGREGPLVSREHALHQLCRLGHVLVQVGLCGVGRTGDMNSIGAAAGA